MLRSSIKAASPEIQELIDNIIDEENRFLLRERREATRKAITRQVRIQPVNERGKFYDAISRDISCHGIGLIGQVQWKPDTVAKMVIGRFDGKHSVVVAKCRWCDDFASGWFLSGWNFVRVESP